MDFFSLTPKKMHKNNGSDFMYPVEIGLLVVPVKLVLTYSKLK